MYNKDVLTAFGIVNFVLSNFRLVQTTIDNSENQ